MKVLEKQKDGAVILDVGVGTAGTYVCCIALHYMCMMITIMCTYVSCLDYYGGPTNH